MKYRRLGNSLLEVSEVGLGGLHFGVFCDRPATAKIIYKAMDLGINFLDTAPMYGNGHSEEFIRDAIKDCRKKIIIGTKVGLEPAYAADGTFGVKVVPLKKKFIRKSIEKSLAALGTDYIDLYQVHAFDTSTPIEETLNVLAGLAKEGKIRFWGCSNYDGAEFSFVAKKAMHSGRSNFVSLQCHYNMIERRAEEKIIPECLRYNCSIICYRALCRGILSGKYKFNHPLPDNSRAQVSGRVKKWLTRDTLLLTDHLGDFVKSRGRTLAELSIAWLLSRKGVASALIGVRNTDQLEECAKATDWQLTAKEILGVEDIIAKLGLTKQVNSLPDTFLEK